MISHNMSVDLPTVSTTSLQEQRRVLQQLRSELILRYRPHILEGPGPIRVMARIVDELESECRKRHIAEEVMRAEIVNRTIGDVNLRLVTEYEGEPGGPTDYRLLADELGIALPGEQLHGHTATGEIYLWLREQMMECERLLLANNFDLRIYDIYGVGNPVLREWLAQEMGKWGIAAKAEQICLNIGAMDSIDKVLHGLMHMYRTQHISDVGILFPDPGFTVPKWQASASGYQLYNIPTLPEHRFKLTARQLDQMLQEAPHIRILYLTVTNNPTTFAYTADELKELLAMLRQYWDRGHQIFILTDLAYIGTGKPEEDRMRMASFTAPDILAHTIFISSLSKTYTLTGERFGWVTCGNPEIAAAIAPSWTNSMASLPGEWQLRFMAYLRLLQARPWLSEKLRAFYRLRRTRLIKQLQRINEELHLFTHIYVDDDATVYNWSQLRPGEDAFSVFEKTGIAGVPGSGFGYTDDYIRFSIGVIPVEELFPPQKSDPPETT